MADNHHSETEIWRPVPGYEGYYEVSSLGRIRSVARCVTKRNGVTMPVASKIMRPQTNGKYLFIHLRKDFEGKQLYVHRLVALAFLGDQPEGHYEVAHFDGCPTNNRLSNLRWATRSENREDQRRHGTLMIGDGHKNATLTEAQVREVRRRYVPYRVTQSALAKEYGVHVSAIRRAVTRTCWRHI